MKPTRQTREGVADAHACSRADPARPGPDAYPQRYASLPA